MTRAKSNLFLSKTTLRQIEVMVTLQQQGSMTKAARALNMSVANVSRVSKRFETNLGIGLFENKSQAGRRFCLAAEASDFLAQLAPLLREIKSLEMQIESLNGLGPDKVS